VTKFAFITNKTCSFDERKKKFYTTNLKQKWKIHWTVRIIWKSWLGNFSWKYTQLLEIKSSFLFMLLCTIKHLLLNWSALRYNQAQHNTSTAKPKEKQPTSFPRTINLTDIHFTDEEQKTTGSRTPIQHGKTDEDSLGKPSHRVGTRHKTSGREATEPFLHNGRQEIETATQH